MLVSSNTYPRMLSMNYDRPGVRPITYPTALKHSMKAVLNRLHKSRTYGSYLLL